MCGALTQISRSGRYFTRILSRYLAVPDRFRNFFLHCQLANANLNEFNDCQSIAGVQNFRRQEQPLGIWSLPTETNQPQMPTKDASSNLDAFLQHMRRCDWDVSLPEKNCTKFYAAWHKSSFSHSEVFLVQITRAWHLSVVDLLRRCNKAQPGSSLNSLVLGDGRPPTFSRESL